MRPPDLAREITVLVRHRDIAGLREIITEYGEELARTLDVDAQSMAALTAADDAHLVDHLQSVLRRLGAARRATSAANAERRATAAAAELVRTAVHENETVLLDAHLLLGTVLAHPTVYLAFALSADEHICVERRRLRRAAEVLRSVPNLRAFVDSRGVHLRWRNGRGGLSFWPKPTKRTDAVFLVDLIPRRPEPVVALAPMSVVHPSPQRPWLADALGDVGLFT